MKLNLLPTEVSKGGMLILSMIAGVFILLASVAAAFLMITHSNAQLARQKERVETLKPLYERAMAVSKEADTIMAASVDLDRNIKLADAMQEHNGKVAALYDEVQNYLPSWFRLTSLSTTPSEKQTVVNLSGVLYSYQQYADMMLALSRIPDAVTVGRTGFTDPGRKTPALIETDQRGMPLKPGETNLPSDPWERFNAMIARANSAPSGYLNTGNFGSGERGTKGNMPEWSNVTFTLVLNRDTQVPDAGATLRAGGAAPQGTAPAPGNNANANTVKTPGAPPASNRGDRE